MQEHVDRKELRRAVEDIFDKYRLYKYDKYQTRQASTTQSYQAREHGPTGVTSDSTASAAIQNADEPIRRLRFCEKVERAVNKLPIKELKLIKLVHMQKEVVFDYERVLGISRETYRVRRDSAFDNLARILVREQ